MRRLFFFKFSSLFLVMTPNPIHWTTTERYETKCTLLLCLFSQHHSDCSQYRCSWNPTGWTRYHGDRVDLCGSSHWWHHSHHCCGLGFVSKGSSFHNEELSTIKPIWEMVMALAVFQEIYLALSWKLHNSNTDSMYHIWCIWTLMSLYTENSINCSYIYYQSKVWMHKEMNLVFWKKSWFYNVAVIQRRLY